MHEARPGRGNEGLPRITEFEAALGKLESETGDGPELITLYIPPDKPIHEVMVHLKDEYAKTDRITDKETRSHVQDAISSILSRLRGYERLPPHGLAIFCGKERTTVDRADLPCTVIEPVEPLNIYLFRSAPVYDVEPLKHMLDAMNVYGLLVLDVREAHWGFLRGNRVEYEGGTSADVPDRQRKGGQSALRFQHLREIAINGFFARVGDHASASFLAERDFFRRFRGLLVGGRNPTREDFLAGNYLNHEVRQKVIGEFDVARTDRKGLSLLADTARGAIEGLDIRTQEAFLERFHRDLESGAGLAVHGEESVRKNLAAGAVGTLLLSASLRSRRFKVTCQDCGHAEERTFPLEEETGVKDILAHTCHVCSAPVIETDVVDLTEELTLLADHIHAKTVIISEGADAGGAFLNDYGGIGAILRYRKEG